MTRLLFSLLVACFCLVSSKVVFAQKEGNNWYFGYKAGLNFNSNPPQVLFNGQSDSKMGHASISDRNGNLLFYFGGSGYNKSIYNRNHVPMPNGGGFHTFSVSNLIIPWPGQNKYYFITNYFNYPNTYNGYSVIDMSLNNGLGDITATKNKFLHTTSSAFGPGGISNNHGSGAVKHRNNRDYWYITTSPNRTSLHAYLISPAGLDTIPVISPISQTVIHSSIKASPDGRTLALVGRFGSAATIEIYNFDPATGVVTHKFTITSQVPNRATEFSPDGSKLYVLAYNISITGPVAHDAIWQYDLLAGSPADVQNSGTIVGTTDNNFYSRPPQVGPDGKIYMTTDSAANKYLHVIHRPNLKGKACRYQKNAIDLDPTNSYVNISAFKAGDILPSFVQSFFYRPRIDMQQTCFGDTARFDLSNRAYADSIDWNFGDPASGSLNTSNSFTPKHYYAAGGTYQVRAIVHFNFTSDTVLQTISIPHTIVKPNLGNDTTLCQGDTLRLRAYQFGATYEWQDSITTDSVFTVTKSGQFWVLVSNGCGIRGDTINVQFHQPLQTNFSSDTTLCAGQRLTLKATAAGGQILWQNGSTQPTFTVTQPGTYSVQVSNRCGTYKDSIKVNYRTMPTRWLPNDTILCSPAGILLDATNPNAVEYVWQDGSRNPQFIAKYAGNYWVQVKTICNTTVLDNIKISYNQKPTTFFPADTTVCTGENLVLKAPPGLRYTWNTAETTQQITVGKAGIYKVKVETAPNCFFTDSITVTETRCFKTPVIQNIVTPNRDNLNDRFVPKGLEAGTWQVEIYNRWGVKIYENATYTDQWPDSEIKGGTYYYLLRNTTSGKTHKGWVEIAK